MEYMMKPFRHFVVVVVDDDALKLVKLKYI